MTVNQRVEALRSWMRDHGVDAYIVPTSDPHNDEYIPPHWMCREWITGFTGSAGTAIITLTRAALWTDSRYWLQAAEQLADTPFELMRDGEPRTLTPAIWLGCQKQNGADFIVAGPDDMLTPFTARWLREAGLTLRTGLPDAFDAIWADRPALPAAPIVVQPEQWTGRAAADKLHAAAFRITPWLKADCYLFNDLSDIAWLLNLRGSDIAYNPVFVAYLVYFREDEHFALFTHTDTLTPEAYDKLRRYDVSLREYDEIADFCRRHSVQAADSVPLSLPLKQSEPLASPVGQMRAVKNEAEREGFRQAMLRDGVAMVQFLRWLQEEVGSGRRVTEISASQRLSDLRAAQPGFCDLSFATIAGYGPHGAIVHYEAEPHTDAELRPEGLLLLDSGAQYESGTTDITRTIALGPVTDEMRRVYTLVLKGHLALARQRFPEGTTGLQLDLAARSAMWHHGYDFGHGTGHGVGSHLCVHEGPHQIRKDLRDCTLVPFADGMVVTNEPGIYLAGRFGVRIENVLLCRHALQTDFGRFLEFEDLTLCPYDLRPLDLSLLTAGEVEQIDAYHAEVRRRLMPLLTDEADRDWLAKATEPLK